jgi:hypothetical protein
MKTSAALGAALFVLAAGCSGSGSTAPASSSLDCAWLAGDNCVKATLLENRAVRRLFGAPRTRGSGRARRSHQHESALARSPTCFQHLSFRC